MLLQPPTHALVRHPGPNAAEGLTDVHEPADPDAIAAEHAASVTALRDAGLKVIELPADPDRPDGYFVEDVAVCLGPELVVLTNPGAPERRGEVDAVAEALPHPTKLRLTDVGGSDATLDGGDVLIADDRVLVGLSRRTNIAGARALAGILARHHPTWPVSIIRIQGVLHLKTGLTEVTPGTVLRAAAMRPPADVFALAGLDEVLVDDVNHANVVPLGDVTLVPEGARAAARIAGRRTRVIEVPLTHIGRMDGGLTCLSLRW